MEELAADNSINLVIREGDILIGSFGFLSISTLGELWPTCVLVSNGEDIGCLVSLTQDIGGEGSDEGLGDGVTNLGELGNGFEGQACLVLVKTGGDGLFRPWP